MNNIRWTRRLFPMAILVTGLLGGAGRVVAQETVLWNFCVNSSCTDGDFPDGGLIADGAGNLYGTTEAGGANGQGSVFEIPVGGGLRTLYSFCAQQGCPDGAAPYGGALVFDSRGNLFGTTYSYGKGGGTVFELSPAGGGAWTFNTLYKFCSLPKCADGQYPNGQLAILGLNKLVGTTTGGHGVLFQLLQTQPNVWTETVVYRFCSRVNCADGSDPTGLSVDRVGNLYGTTRGGGAHNGGTVFEIPLNGAQAVLYSFCPVAGCADGLAPTGGVILANGLLYGTTEDGGANGKGTLYSLHQGVETVLHNFGVGLDGTLPVSTLVDSLGNLYGTTSSGGAHNGGTVFEIPFNGAETVLYSFCGLANCLDGSSPQFGPLLFLNGHLFGTTTGGGRYNGGTVFQIH
jgi:uncharacterized repeat protein (TIGR03803 family)